MQKENDIKKECFLWKVTTHINIRKAEHKMGNSRNLQKNVKYRIPQYYDYQPKGAVRKTQD